MEPNVKKDILSTINSAVKILKKHDVIELDILSNKRFGAGGFTVILSPEQPFWKMALQSESKDGTGK